MNLVFLRHGQTEWNVQGRFQGTQDSPLTRLGVLQACAHERWLRREPPKRVLCSPAVRALRTARMATASLATEPNLDARLGERAMGIFEGMTLEAIQRDHPEEYAARQRDPWNHRPPGGESYPDLQLRLEPLVAEWRASGTDGRLLVVTHSTLLRALLGSLLGLSREETMSVQVPNDVAWCVRGAGESLRVSHVVDGVERAGVFTG